MVELESLPPQITSFPPGRKAAVWAYLPSSKGGREQLADVGKVELDVM